MVSQLTGVYLHWREAGLWNIHKPYFVLHTLVTGRHQLTFLRWKVGAGYENWLVCIFILHAQMGSLAYLLLHRVAIHPQHPCLRIPGPMVVFSPISGVWCRAFILKSILFWKLNNRRKEQMHIMSTEHHLFHNLNYPTVRKLILGLSIEVRVSILRVHSVWRWQLVRWVGKTAIIYWLWWLLTVP